MIFEAIIKLDTSTLPGKLYHMSCRLHLLLGIDVCSSFQNSSKAIEITCMSDVTYAWSTVQRYGLTQVQVTLED